MKVFSHRSALALIILLILVPVLASYYISGIKHGEKTWLIAADGLGYYAPLRSIMIDKDINLENEYRDYNPYHFSVAGDKTKTGLVVLQYPIGQAALWIPFFIIAHAFVLLASWFGFNIPADGYSSPYHFCISFGSVLYGVIGLFFIYRTLALYYKKNIAAFSVLFTLLGTNLCYYFIFAATVCHLPSMCVISVFTYYFLITKGAINPGRYIILGLLYALMILVRYQNGLFGAIIVLEFLENRDSFQWKIVFKNLVCGAAGFFPLIALQMILWKIIYGSWLVYSYADVGFNFFQPHLLEVLFSSRHGLISWTPMVALCCMGMVFAIRRTRAFGIVCLIIFLGQLWVNASWDMWWFGHSYGSRVFIECSPIFCLGMAALLEKALQNKLQQFLFFITIAVLISWNFILALFFSIGLVPHDGYFNWIVLVKSWGPPVSHFLSSRL